VILEFSALQFLKCFVLFSVEACDKFLEQGEHKEVIRYVESSYIT